MGLWISTHSLTRRLTEIYTRKRNPSEISTHSLTRRLTSERRLRAWQEKISTHSLTRRLTKQKDMLTMIWSISTHSLTRRLTKNKGFFLINYTFQLTASQGGWLHGGNNNDKRTGISTHSLTRRLTVSYRKCFHGCSISTHSLTRRLTKCCSSVITFSRYFNSQPHKEADGKQHQKEHCQRIFQLTASQGGWPIRYRNLLLTQDFNSQPHKEADCGAWWI